MKKLLTYLRQELYLWRLAKIETKLFARQKQEEKELRRKYYNTSKPPHFKLWLAAQTAMEKRHDQEHAQAIKAIHWMKPRNIEATIKTNSPYRRWSAPK